MVAGAEQGSRQMRHSQANEHDGAAVGGDDSHENARGEDDQRAGSLYVEAEVAGVGIAQHQQVHGLHEQHTQRQEYGHQHHEEHHLVA